MANIFGYIVLFIFMEVIFWGIAYTTGRVLTPAISFGSWYAEPIKVNIETGKKEKKQTGLRLVEKSGKTYLGTTGVCLVGIFFWGIIVTVLLFV